MYECNMNGVVAIRHKQDGKKILILAEKEKGVTIRKRIYLVEHMLDDDFAVTEHTLRIEKDEFKDIRLSSKKEVER